MSSPLASATCFDLLDAGGALIFIQGAFTVKEVSIDTMGGDGQKEFGVRVAGIAEDQGEGRLVYEPGHPDADASGYVRYPDIDTTQELVRLMDAKRMYEANAAVFQTAKSMLRASLDI